MARGYPNIHAMLLALTLSVVVNLVASEFNLTVIHTSDFHARYKPFNGYGRECKPSELAQEGKCFSGYARVEALVKKLRVEYPTSLLLDAGDASHGNLWYAIHRINITSHFMNRLGYDAMAPGTHEFDNEEANIIKFAKLMDCPVLSCNLNKTNVPEAGNETIPFTILTVGGEKFGIVGYTTTYTPIVSLPGRFTFDDELTSVRREVEKLQAKGIKKIIVVGTGGFDKDKEIAAAVDGIDLIVGGYSNTFLYTGTPPGRDTPDGEYPFVVNQTSGRKVLIVHSYFFIKYLGLLHVTFDDNGEITSWSGNPIYITDKYPEDASALEDIARWQVQIDQARNTELSRSSVYINQSTCRYEECNLGNMIADSLVFRFSLDPPEDSWTHAGIGLVNSGSLRVSIPKGIITLSTLLEVQPYANTQDIITIPGKYLRLVLLHSFVNQTRKGGFLQYAGLKVTYKYHSYQPNLTEISEVLVRCSKCNIPRWGPLDDDTDYTVVVNSFIIAGGDGYYHFKKWGKDHRIVGLIDNELTADFVKRTYPVIYGIEDRIKIIEFKTPEEAAADKAELVCEEQATAAPPPALPCGTSHCYPNLLLILSTVFILCAFK